MPCLTGVHPHEPLTDTVMSDPLAHVVQGYHRFRRYAPRMLRALDIACASVAEPLVAALFAQGRLIGLIHFTYRDGILWGPGLHEVMHAWANYIVDPGSRVGAHWGFSSANGQLGGFDINDLVDRGNDEYTAGRFGTFANGGNSVPYSPIELYLAGWIGPEDVPDLWLGRNARGSSKGGS